MLPLVNSLRNPNSSLTGNFELHAAFESRFLAQPRDVLIYLPPDYYESPWRRYPVFYMHDGQNLFDGATSFIAGREWRVDETAEFLIRSGAIEPVIIVGIYNTGEHRISEYTPSRDPRFPRSGRARRYARMITEELKPMIDSHYRTLPDPANCGVGGSSLGGLVSLYIALAYPHVFTKAALMSPSVWWGRGIMMKRIDDLERRPDLRFWLDIGTQEGGAALASVRQLRDALTRRGWKEGESLSYLEVEGGMHDELAWADRVEPMLKFLFAFKAKS